MIGKEIKAGMAKAGMTQKELAEAIGVSQWVVGNLVRDETQVTVQRMIELHETGVIDAVEVIQDLVKS